MRTGDRLCRVELVQLRRKAAAEDIRPRQRQKPDAGTFAGHGTEQTRGSQIARAAFPRAFLHLITRQGGYRKQHQTLAIPRRQDRLQLLQGLGGKGLLQPGDFRKRHADGGD